MTTMFLLVLAAYLGGVLTILSPCILPVLPFVFARAGRPFRSHGLPLLLAMALAFAAVATLAALGGAWVVAVNQYGRYAAMALLAGFGLTLLLPTLAERISRPFVALGWRLSEPRPGAQANVMSPLVLGFATGLLWAPCAGPILGLILTGAAIDGPGFETSLSLLAYAVGACTSLAVALLFGARLLSLRRGSLRTGEWIRRAAGAAVIAGVGAIASGLDTGVLSRISTAGTFAIETDLVDRIGASTPQSPQVDSVARPEDAAPMLEVAEREPAPARSLPTEGTFPSLGGATEWINSAPLTPEGLRGKVVLIDFWTYSCINCLRTLPYVRAWADKYKDDGLVVIGVHTPEFAFEKRSANVRRATRDLGLGFPIAVDSDFGIWRAFGNRFWPAFYFVDVQGRIRHHQFGEGQYGRSEQVIQQLLAEAGRTQRPPGLVSPTGQGVQAAPSPVPARTQETYLGYERADNFASPGGIVSDREHVYEGARSLRPNRWALTGGWTVEAERAVLTRAPGRIAFRFQARDLHLVLGSSTQGRPARFRVLLDGRPPLSDHGADTDEQGNGTIDGQRLYQLVRQSGSAGERLFEIELLDDGAQAYVFTFG